MDSPVALALPGNCLHSPSTLYEANTGASSFESPEECKQIIEQFNGKCVGENGEPISIRFADTADQKKLKMVTQERRQFKTHEYNVAAYGPNSPYQYSPATAYSSPLQPRSPGISGHWGNSGAVGSALLVFLKMFSVVAKSVPGSRLIKRFQLPTLLRLWPLVQS